MRSEPVDAHLVNNMASTNVFGWRLFLNYSPHLLETWELGGIFSFLSDVLSSCYNGLVHRTWHLHWTWESIPEVDNLPPGSIEPGSSSISGINPDLKIVWMVAPR